ncbi:hypothetical protein [Paenibacillus sp. YIM B09110]|uniref:hypothetical protein n=1 Tax=Paenibacillus sp. YIM B09110 TaxID=3126102 RepID=UPI00301C0CD6
MKQRSLRYFLYGAPIIAVLTLFVMNLWFASPFVRSWDEVDFVLAVDRFDLLAMQPHFPGYPYFIAGAKLLHTWMSDPVKSLINWNAALACSSAIPIALLARRYISGITAIWVSVAVQTMPYLWLMGSRPMSECAGIAVLWWFLWSIRMAADRPESNLRLGVAIVSFSLLMGIRVSYFPFGLALLLLLVYQYRSEANRRIGLRRLSLALIAAAGAQMIWIGGLAMSEGTLEGFWNLSMAFVAGHFSEWGGGVASAQVPFGTRVVTLVYDHLIREVLLSRSVVLGAIYGCLIALTGCGIWRLGSNRRRSVVDGLKHHEWLLIVLAAYGGWVLLGQNIEKPRHIAPIAGPLMLLVYVSALKAAHWLRRTSESGREQQLWDKVNAAAIQLTLTAVVIVQFIAGAQLLELQAEQRPSIYQLDDYMETIEEPFVLYTWEETRVLGYLQAEYEHRKVYTLDYFHAIASSETERRVFLTDHVLKGFLAQNKNAGMNVVPVAYISSDNRFDPVYSEITLYEWKRAYDN